MPLITALWKYESAHLFLAEVLWFSKSWVENICGEPKLNTIKYYIFKIKCGIILFYQWIYILKKKSMTVLWYNQALHEIFT